MKQEESNSPVYKDTEESAGTNVEAMAFRKCFFSEQQLLNVGETALDQRKLPRTCTTCVEKSKSNFKASKNRLILILRVNVVSD